MTQHPSGAEALTHPDLAAPHGFFTRRGGVSTGAFASLNCSLSGKDERECVMENRARAARALGAEPAGLVGLTQVHGNVVAEVRTAWAPGDGPRADAMVTRQPSISLGIVTADCAPVLFADVEAGVVGAAHAGWRGAVGGVLEETLVAMRRLGARLDDIVAVVGPCIAQASYEVGTDLREAVLGENPDDTGFFAEGRRHDHWQFDLAGYCRARLVAAGVTQAAALGADTMADEARFFSHRRRTLRQEGPIGHQISIIRLPDRAGAD